MEGVGGAGRGGVSLSSQSPPPSSSASASRKEWRARNASSEEMDRAKLGQSDERTIYEVQQGQEALDAVDFCSIQMDGMSGADDGILQQRLHNIARQREELQHMEIELQAQMIAKTEIMDIQNSYDARLKEQANASARLQEQLREREQTMQELERKLEEKERELHAAWAKEDLLRDQSNELASFRRERDSIEAERSHHIKQIHELQEHLQDKERQLLELQEQHRAAQEILLSKDREMREIQAWVAQLQDSMQSNTLQAELRERTEQYNQLIWGCQRQYAEMERMHMQMQQLQLELVSARGSSGNYNAESNISQNTSSDGSQMERNIGNSVEANGGSTANGGAGGLANGNLESVHSFVSPGNSSAPTNHMSSGPISQSILGMPSYLQPGQVTALHPYVMHQGANHSVQSQVPQTHVGQYHSVPDMASYQQWQNQQGASEGLQVTSQNQYPMSQAEENPSRSESTYGYEFSVYGTGRPDYANAHVNQGLDPNSGMSSAEEPQTLESVENSYLVPSETQRSLQQISSQFHEALRLDPRTQNNDIKEDNRINIAVNRSESQDVVTEQPSSVVSPPQSDSPVRPGHFAEAVVNSAADAVSSEGFVPTGQTNSLPTGNLSEPPLLDERALLACIVRTVPAGGKIRISSTLPNRLGKMLAPLHWHDYKKKFGKLDDFVANHPELFVIEGDFIQLREGAQGIIAATAAVAKVAAAAAAASSPYSSYFPSVAVTPMAHAGGRIKKVPSMESKPMQNHQSNGSAFNGSGGFTNVKILSKSKDAFDLNGSGIRPGQSLPVPAENGGMNSVQSKAAIHARSGANFVGNQQQGRASGPFPSRR